MVIDFKKVIKMIIEDVILRYFLFQYSNEFDDGGAV